MKYEEIKNKIDYLKRRVTWKKSDLEEAELELEMAEEYLTNKIEKGRGDNNDVTD